MSGAAKRLYLLLGSLMVLGYGWLAFSLFQGTSSEMVLCPVKNISGYPCPSCGSTRAVILLIQGEFSEAMLSNPLGFIILLLMIILPIWMIFDVLTERMSLFHTYRKVEKWLRKRQIAIPLLLLVLANWIWNINKGL